MSPIRYFGALFTLIFLVSFGGKADSDCCPVSPLGTDPLNFLAENKTEKASSPPQNPQAKPINQSSFIKEIKEAHDKAVVKNLRTKPLDQTRFLMTLYNF